MIGRLALLLSLAVAAHASEWHVGPGRQFARIEDAVQRAAAGDTVLVHPLRDGKAYVRPAVFVRKARLTIRGVGGGVRLDGRGYNYSGNGAQSRAIFQFQRGADGCVLEGFELFGARGEDHNGSGVRIVYANRVTIRDCEIHHNDMGIMSSGDGTAHSAADQLIERCTIHHNGTTKNPGYNHNLYLAGTSATVRSCDIHSSVTGHNLKSRCHKTRVETCYIHHSSNREFDLVDGKRTGLPDSDAILIGNVIVKDPDCAGNRAVIHFGQDGGRKHTGTVRVSFNTIVTPFGAAVIQLSSPGARALLTGNLVIGTGRHLAAPGAERVRGSGNWFAGAFHSGTLDPKANTFAALPRPWFENPGAHDYRPTAATARKLTAAEAANPPATQYRHPCKAIARPRKATIPGATTR